MGNMNGISVVTSLSRKYRIQNAIDNFRRQLLESKEIIIIINNDEIEIEDFKDYIEQDKRIQVYKLPQSFTLGQCLNFGVFKAHYGYISKMDDDDFYADFYLQDVYDTFRRTKSDVVCKRTNFIYLEEFGKLVLYGRYYLENDFVDRGGGGTLSFKKEVFEFIKFKSVLVGTDSKFYDDCSKYNLKVYSNSRYGYLCYRSKDLSKHTWKMTAEHLLKIAKPYYAQEMPLEKARKIAERIEQEEWKIPD